MATDIAPGIGNKGIESARRLLMERCRLAMVEAAYADNVRVLEESDVPFICVTFDGYTSLTVRLWDSRDIEQGFRPWWRLETGRLFTWNVAADRQRRPARWDSEAELMLVAVQRVILTINFVDTP